MNRFQRFYLLIAGLFLAFSFWVPPVHAFTSLQGCYQRPECAKLLIDHGMIGGSVVPQGVITSPTAAAAISSGAPAAQSLAIPAAVGTGLAALVFPWSQDKADQLAKPYLPPFHGGQCEAEYMVRAASYTYTAYGAQQTASATGYNIAPGPLSFDSTALSQTIYWASGASLAAVDVSNTLGIESLDSVDWDIKRNDGQPDDCGSPDPELQPNELPSLDDLEKTFGTPQEVPWPPSQPGPDGELGNEDDVYPPFVLPGPVISPDSAGNPSYSPSDFTLPNPQASPDPDPSTDPGADPGTDPEPELTLNAPPDQSSGCNGWGYAICELSGKFPFDIVGELPDAPPAYCPSFEFFGQGAEFCFIRDLLASIKYVASASLIVYGVMNL